MITLGAQTQVYLAAGATDMHKQIDGLAALVVDELAGDPFSSQAGLLIQLATPLAPIAAALQAQLRQGRVIHADETPVQVLGEPGRNNDQASYMWVFCGGPPEAPVRWFEYAASRAASVPTRVLLQAPT